MSYPSLPLPPPSSPLSPSLPLHPLSPPPSPFIPSLPLPPWPTESSRSSGTHSGWELLAEVTETSVARPFPVPTFLVLPFPAPQFLEGREMTLNPQEQQDECKIPSLSQPLT